MRQYSASVGLPFDAVACAAAVAGREEARRKGKQRRFFVRLMRGFDCAIARGLRIRWFVLTESPLSVASGVSFYPTFHRFVDWLRYWYPDFQYCVVEHRKLRLGGELRSDFHVVCFGEDYLAAESMEYWWSEHYLGSVTGMEAIWSPRSVGSYLAGYLSGSDSGRFIKATYSQNWIFPGFVRISRRIHHVWGRYLDGVELAELSCLTRGERAWVLAQFGERSRFRRDYLEGCGDVKVGRRRGRDDL